MSTYILLLICIVFSAFASISLKLGATNIKDSFQIENIISNKAIWLGALFYTLAFLSYIVVLRVTPLAIAQPVITTGSSLLAVLVATFFLNESMSLINWGGLILICLGIYLLFYGQTQLS